MGDRLSDYALVAVGVVALFGLFKLARLILEGLLRSLEQRSRTMSSDRALLAGLLLLLGGLLFLPIFTSVLALFDKTRLTGGMLLHLVLVAISVLVFSISEDLFRTYRSFPVLERWTVKRHLAIAAPSLMAFWVVGTLFLSPLFYSGLTLIVFVFYLFALSLRGAGQTEKAGDDG